MSHDPSRPIGRILSSSETDQGVLIEAELLQGEGELESLRRRAGGGVTSRLSIAFHPDRRADRWSKSDGSVPLVSRRNVTIKETSAVLWPAYPGARVTGIYARTAAAVARHAESERVIREMTALSAEVRTRLAARRR
jgi:phage head maturation protease